MPTLTNSLAYILGTIKSSFMPAFFLAVALVMFYAQNPFEFHLSQSFYYIFISVSLVGLVLLYTTNQSKPFFSFLLGFVAILALNWLKKNIGADFKLAPQYVWLSFLLPFNLVLFYFLPVRRLKSNFGLFFLFIMLIQMAIVEHADKYVWPWPYGDFLGEKLPLWSMFVWLAALALLAVNISFKNTLINTGLFYADTALFLGFMYAQSASAISIFGLAFALILLSVTLFSLYYRYHYDELRHVYSYNVYLSRALGKFPFKYTVGVFCLDNREKIIAQIGEKNIGDLEQMLINKMIADAPEDTEFYRYKENEFLLVFKNEDAKHAYEYCDNIRRSVAAAEFILTAKHKIKMTISICVSEKTRKYIEPNIVVERGHNGLQKGSKFNSNIVTKAG